VRRVASGRTGISLSLRDSGASNSPPNLMHIIARIEQDQTHRVETYNRYKEERSKECNAVKLFPPYMTRPRVEKTTTRIDLEGLPLGQT